MDLDPAHWLNIGQQAAVIIGIGLLFGGPVGLVVWRRTNRRPPAIGAGIVAAIVGLLFVGYLYYAMVLCPPGAGCV